MFKSHSATQSHFLLPFAQMSKQTRNPSVNYGLPFCPHWEAMVNDFKSRQDMKSILNQGLF